MWIHNDCIGTFDLYVLILCVFEGALFVQLCIHIVGMGTFGHHELILHEYEGATSVLSHIHIANIDDVSAPYWLKGCVLMATVNRTQSITRY